MVARAAFHVDCPDGWRLHGELLTPENTRAVAVVGHAMFVDRRTLDRPRGEGLVSHLAARGIAVVWPDLRGHGKSGPRPEDGGDWTYDQLVADVPALLDFARAQFPGLPLHAVGHSLFGHVTLAHLARHPETALDGLVMLACNTANPEWRARPLRWLEKGAYVALSGTLVRLFGRVPIRRLKLGSDDEPRGYIDDFVRTWLIADWRARDGFSYYAALPSVRTPILAMVGAGDRLFSPPVDVQGLMRRVPRAEVEIVGRRSGLPVDPGHMALVLDPRMRPVWERAASFMLR